MVLRKRVREQDCPTSRREEGSLWLREESALEWSTPPALHGPSRFACSLLAGTALRSTDVLAQASRAVRRGVLDGELADRVIEGAVRHGSTRVCH
jgi:hypothetical protein